MLKQAEAEVVPSSSLVKVRVEVLVKVEVEVGVCLSGSSRDKFTTFSGVGGWLGGFCGTELEIVAAPGHEVPSRFGGKQ